MSDPIDDEIGQLAAALRSETSGRSNDAAKTRAEVLRSARTAPRNNQAALLAAAAVLLAFALGAPTAWAWWTGWLATTATSEAPVEATAHEPTPPPREAPQVVAPPPVEAEVMPSPEPEVAALPPDPIPAARPPIDPIERRTYEEAHALHFDDHDAPAAIGAWERYLAVYPRGRFALEARYNRALCLVRVGRGDEARQALQPFADGEPGAYRQREASDLLEAMSVAP